MKAAKESSCKASALAPFLRSDVELRNCDSKIVRAECSPTSVATGRKCLAGKRQANPGQGPETCTGLDPSQGVAVCPAAGTAEVDWDARVGPS